MPIDSNPKFVVGPRQQLTTGTEVRDCLLKANSRLLLPTPTSHKRNGSAGMPFDSKPKYIDGPGKQITTGTELRECLLQGTQDR